MGIEVIVDAWYETKRPYGHTTFYAASASLEALALVTALMPRRVTHEGEVTDFGTLPVGASRVAAFEGEFVLSVTTPHAISDELAFLCVQEWIEAVNHPSGLVHETRMQEMVNLACA